MAKTYKSGDIVGKLETGHTKRDAPFLPPYFEAETYTWRLRFLANYKIWVLTKTSSLQSVYNGHEVIQSATNLNQYTIDPDFMMSEFVTGNLLANDYTLAKIKLANEQVLGDDAIQDNATQPDANNTANSPKQTTNVPPPQQTTTAGINSTYLVLGGAALLLILIAKR